MGRAPGCWKPGCKTESKSEMCLCARQTKGVLFFISQRDVFSLLIRLLYVTTEAAVTLKRAVGVHNRSSSIYKFSFKKTSSVTGVYED